MLKICSEYSVEFWTQGVFVKRLNEQLKDELTAQGEPDDLRQHLF